MTEFFPVSQGEDENKLFEIRSMNSMATEFKGLLDLSGDTVEINSKNSLGLLWDSSAYRERYVTQLNQHASNTKKVSQ